MKPVAEPAPPAGLYRIVRAVMNSGRTDGLRAQSRQQGFSVAELITVVVILGVLAAMVVPIARFGIRRQREVELRSSLRRITDAIDRYHDLRLKKLIKDIPEQTQGEYPKDLEELVKGVETLPEGKRVKFLRDRDLIDPMTGGKEWLTFSDSDDADARNTNGNNIFDVRSTSTGLALDGKTHYNEW